MATAVTLADGTKIDDTEVYAKHTATTTIKVFLPEITAAGSGSADVAPGAGVTVECTAAGTVEVCDFLSRRVAFVGPYQKLVFKAQSVGNTWSVNPVAMVGTLVFSGTDVVAAGAATPTLGTAAPITAGAPTKYFRVLGDDGVPYILLAWTQA